MGDVVSAATLVTYRCPLCGCSVDVRTTRGATVTCAHSGRRDGMKAALMVRVEREETTS